MVFNMEWPLPCLKIYLEYIFKKLLPPLIIWSSAPFLGLARGLHSPDNFQNSIHFLVQISISGKICMKSRRVVIR